MADRHSNEPEVTVALGPTEPLPIGDLDAPLDGKHMIVNMGPSHPAMHGVTRAVIVALGPRGHAGAVAPRGESSTRGGAALRTRGPLGGGAGVEAGGALGFQLVHGARGHRQSLVAGPGPRKRSGTSRSGTSGWRPLSG